MKRIALLFAAALLALPATAQPVMDEDLFKPAEAVELDDLKWLNRPVVVFADSPFDPSYLEQIDLFERRADDLRDRDVVVLYDTDPEAEGALRKKLRPRGFMMVLIGKDGQVKLRKPAPWDVRELGRVIDKMPMRQREIRERRADPIR